MIERRGRPDVVSIQVPDRLLARRRPEDAPDIAAAKGGFGAIVWQLHFIERFPRPLAHSYGRLKEEATKGDAVAAAWALRDAWESAVRFAACLGVADLVQAGIRSDAFAAISAGPAARHARP